MTELTATRRSGRWRFSRRDIPCTAPASLAQGGMDGRAAAWKAAQALSIDSSPWDLEYFKASLGEPEIIVGLAEMLAADCSSQQTDDYLQADFTISAPARYLNVRTAMRALARRRLVVGGLRWQAFVDRAQFVVASLGACTVLLTYLTRYSNYSASAASHIDLFLAVHGEWSNRTRHVLTQLGHDFSAEAIILLGRVRTSPKLIVQNWTDKLGIKLPPVFVPISTSAAIRAIPQILNLLWKGICISSQQRHLPGLRDHAAIVFRVLLGAVMHQYWKDSGFTGGMVVYGHTGTADTTMLERAQQSTGATTIHVVHGIATGPNFLGISDIAVFRCGHDARLYESLHQYRRCLAPPSATPKPRRGESGMLILTNYAHSMNPGYIARGLTDELRVLRDVAALATQLGPRAKPLMWKPHPEISELPAPLKKQLVDEAKSLGYELVPHHATPSDAAAQAHWTLATPSTVSLDLLLEGYLCIVLDWQASHVDAAAAKFPTSVSTTAELEDMLNYLDRENAYDDSFQTAWSKQAPAQALKLGSLIKGLQ